MSTGASLTAWIDGRNAAPNSGCWRQGESCQINEKANDTLQKSQWLAGWNRKKKRKPLLEEEYIYRRKEAREGKRGKEFFSLAPQSESYSGTMVRYSCSERQIGLLHTEYSGCPSCSSSFQKIKKTKRVWIRGPIMNHRIPSQRIPLALQLTRVSIFSLDLIN